MNPNDTGNQPLYPLDYRSPRAVAENFLTDYSMRAFLAGKQLYASGRHLNAIMAFKYGLQHDPSELRLHVMLIVTYSSLNKLPEANRQLEIVRRFQSPAEVAQSIEAFIANWTHIPDAVGDLPICPRNQPPHFTSSLLGIDGEFGNQIFQYAFAKLYTEKHGIRFEAYDWIGRKLFGLHDPAVSRILPFILEIEYLRDDLFSAAPLELGLYDRDSQGYFQVDTKCYAPMKRRFTDLFQPISVVEWILKSFLLEIRKKGKTLVAIHLRRGDADTQGRMTGVRPYVEWLRGIWPMLEEPVLFLASDNIQAVRLDLEEFHPITAEHIQLPVPGIGFYPDFYVMTQADYLAAGNSTFSFAASMLNGRAKVFMRPNAANTGLEPYDPWRSKPIV